MEGIGRWMDGCVNGTSKRAGEVAGVTYRLPWTFSIKDVMRWKYDDDASPLLLGCNGVGRPRSLEFACNFSVVMIS